MLYRITIRWSERLLMIKLKFDENLGEYGNLKIVEGDIEFGAMYAQKHGSTLDRGSLLVAQPPSTDDDVDFYDLNENYFDDPTCFDGITMYRVKVVEV